MTKSYKVLIVDDSRFHRRMIRNILEKSSIFKVIGEASSGGDAIKEVVLNPPDLITLDLEMPGMDGFTFLRWLMTTKPTKTIVVTSKSSNKSVFKALELGAVDFMVKPVKQDSYLLMEIEGLLMRKLSSAIEVDLEKVTLRLAKVQEKVKIPKTVTKGLWKSDIEGIFIASSTGGPPAIQTLINELPGDYPIPIFICQHMPPGFTSLFAKRLSLLTKLNVKEAEENDRPTSGVFIAPGGHHMILEKHRRHVYIKIVSSSKEDRYAPSADRMFLSAAEVYGKRSVGIVLTGMGEDGIIGLAALKKSGGKIIAEDESTCVVWGMPRAAVKRGLVDQVIPLHEISTAMIKIARSRLY